MGNVENFKHLVRINTLSYGIIIPFYRTFWSYLIVPFNNKHRDARLESGTLSNFKQNKKFHNTNFLKQKYVGDFPPNVLTAK